MDFIRPEGGARESHNANNNNNKNNAAATITAAAAATIIDERAAEALAASTTAGVAVGSSSSNHHHSHAAVVVENPYEREERKEAAAHATEDEDEEGEENNHSVTGDDDSEEEEEEDEYEYEEDEDEAAFSGFLVDQPALATIATASSFEDEKPAKIEEEESSSIPTGAAALAASFGDVPAAAAAAASNSSDSASSAAGVAKAAPKWREPSRQAVTMSLRAEQETSGSKRRLAQDLYRIMNKDSTETGFELEPAVEDQMDRWKIRLFAFDPDSQLAKDLRVLGLTAVELEMSFPDHYPFSPPFVRVVRPRFKRQTGFVMNGALCMELLTSDGWNPVNDIESVIVSIRSLLVVGEGRLEAAANLPAAQYAAALEAADHKPDAAKKRMRTNSAGDAVASGYSVSEAKAAYDHLTTYHKKKGWDQSGWWARKG